MFQAGYDIYQIKVWLWKMLWSSLVMVIVSGIWKEVIGIIKYDGGDMICLDLVPCWITMLGGCSL